MPLATVMAVIGNLPWVFTSHCMCTYGSDLAYHGGDVAYSLHPMSCSRPYASIVQSFCPFVDLVELPHPMCPKPGLGHPYS
eukprot:2535224-Karenia_brevis.AAC.1